VVARAREIAGVPTGAKKITSDKAVQVKYLLKEAAAPHIRHSHARRNPSGVPLHAIPAGEKRARLEAKKEKTQDDIIALHRTTCKLSVFETHMQHCVPTGAVDLAGELHRAGIVEAGQPLPAAAALLAFKLEHAVTLADVSVDMMCRQLAQLIYESRLAELKAAGVDFYENAFVPEYHPVFGALLHYHEDYNHKYKLWTSHTRNVHSKGKHPFMLMAKNKVMQALEGITALDHIAAIMSPNADSQNVVTCHEFLQNRRLQGRLEELGHWREASTLKVLGGACQAWGAEGLSREARREKWSAETRLMKATMGEGLQVIDELDHSHVGGYPRGLLLATLTNNQSHASFQRHHPHLCATMVDLFVSTDDCEHEFGTLVRGVGFKPTAVVAMGYFRIQDILLRAKQDPDINCIVPASTKSSYLHHQRRALKEVRWHDPALLELPGPGREKYYAALTKGAAGYVRKKRSIRAFHKT
jgi:hypothetical protein